MITIIEESMMVIAMNMLSQFPVKRAVAEAVIEFDYPLRANQRASFIPSLRQIFMNGIRPTSDGIFISDANAFAEAVEWARSMFSKRDYRVDGRFEKIVCQTRDGEEVVVDGEGVRWGAVFRFLRDEDAVLFKLRFG